MATEISEDKKQALKEIYNNSVSLLELLHVLIPQTESYDASIPVNLLEDVCKRCFELGAAITTNADEIAKIEEDDEEDNPYPFGY